MDHTTTTLSLEESQDLSRLLIPNRVENPILGADSPIVDESVSRLALMIPNRVENPNTPILMIPNRVENPNTPILMIPNKVENLNTGVLTGDVVPTLIESSIIVEDYPLGDPSVWEYLFGI